MANPKILLVDDNENLLKTLSSRLVRSEFSVFTASQAPRALALARNEHPDLIILDLHLEDTDGFEICRKLRENPVTEDIPVLFLTGETQETFKVYGLAIGADDYMVKPFSANELIARIRAILRRVNPAFDQHRKILKIENLELNLVAKELAVYGTKHELSQKEMDLLHCLWTAKGKTLTRDYLLEKVWGYEKGSRITTRTVDVHVRSLRRKLGEEAWRLATVKNQGYRFEKRGKDSAGPE